MAAERPDDALARALTQLPALAPLDAELDAELRALLATGQVTEPGDLLLSLACQRRLPPALAHFEAVVMPKVRAAVRRIAGPDTDDLLQQFRVRVLLGERLRTYSGRGALEAWCRAVAVRMAYELLGTRKVRPLAEAVSTQERSVELSYLLAAHRAQFRAAFGAALQALSARDRTLLRLNAVEGVRLERLGEQYGVNKSTVSRWLSAARAQVLGQVRAELVRELRTSEAELDSLLTLFGSQMSISFSFLE
ncbi:MAG: sigma-70 family RNA polymerase sigma factor [Myxococcaceae bacterium]|nr:sigma-70 family RNA polymerase sigma factor [Myxococcaceae bacterium]